MIAKPLPRGLRIPLAVVLAGAVVATGARGDAAETPAAPREAPLLDKAKGERAVAAYKKFRRALCVELSALRGRPVVAKDRLEEVGLDGVEEDHLCGRRRSPCAGRRLHRARCSKPAPMRSCCRS